ncbi:MAG: exopolysaccharide transport family protein [Acetobacteraceae bacterium]
MDIPVGPQRISSDPGQVLRLTQLGRLLWRRAWLITFCAIVSAALAFLYARTVPKTYTADSAITVEGNQFAIPELQGALRSDSSPDPMPWVRTEVQALTARTLVLDVINRLHLDQDPEFNPSLRPPTLWQNVKNAVQSFLPQQPAATAPGPDEVVLGAVNKALAVFQDNRSLVIGIAFTSQDPRLAANFLNTLLATYIQSRAHNRTTVNERANDVLVQRTTQAKADLDAIEQQMQDLRDKSEMVNLRAGSVGQQQLEELATAAARASVDRAQLESNWDRANALSKQGLSDALVGVLGSTTISRLRDQESVASSRVAELSSRYGKDYPSVRSAMADLQAVRAQVNGEVQRIVASMSAQLKVARDQEAEVKQQLNNARRAGVLAENARAQLDQLQEEEKTRRALYQTLLERSQQTAAQPAGTETPDVRVLSAAVPPGLPSGPNTKMITGLGGLSGAMLGCLLALTRMHRLQAVEDAGAFTRGIGLPVLASIPHALVHAGRNGLANRAATIPPGAGAEVARAVRTRLSFAGRSSAPRTVMFTAVSDGENAAIIAAAVARIAAADGERVLLIEGNMYRPILGRVLGSRASGLVPVLTEGADWRDMLVQDPLGELDLLLASQRVAGSHALLSNVSFQNLLVEAREDYDLIVIDAPNASTTDTATLAQRVDAAVLVTDPKVKRADLAQIVTRLGAACHNSLQAVLVA